MGSRGATAPTAPRSRRWLVVLAGLVAVAALLLLARGRHATAPGRTSPAPTGTPARPGPARARVALADIHVAMNEEIERLPSGIVVERLETDRPFVCTGETMRLNAVLGGVGASEGEPRWIWSSSEGPALEPGRTAFWRAPDEPGLHPLLFQVARDLGGRRVGVLAEGRIDVEVRRCTEAESQDSDPLRITVGDRAHGVFEVEAIVAEGTQITEYRWDFGDGVVESGPEPGRRHAYDVADLRDRDRRSYIIRLQATTARGTTLHASAAAFVAGRPASLRPRVALAIARWRMDPALGRWRSDLTIENPPGEPAVRWEALERTTIYFDDRVELVSLPFAEAVTVLEDLGAGGFRGYVSVDPAAVPPEVRQIIDRLLGVDAAGEPIELSWTPFKREREPAASPPAVPTEKDPPASP